jgi:hypothetical protein
MERMLSSNPGLASRFQRTIHFQDYTAKEPQAIFRAMCKKSHYVLSAPADDKLQAIFQTQIDRQMEHFGNGRFARNLFEQAVRKLANRIIEIAPLTRELLTTLQPEDLETSDV